MSYASAAIARQNVSPSRSGTWRQLKRSNASRASKLESRSRGVQAKEKLRRAEGNFERVQDAIEKALDVSANLHDFHGRADTMVRRLINQSLFEHLWVSTGLMRKARVIGATFREPLVVLAREVPAHVTERNETPERAPELVFGGKFE